MERRFLMYGVTILGFTLMVSCASFNQERFESLLGGVVKDNETGLMWSMTDNGMDLTWESASAYCITYTKGHFANWRMPTVGELETILKSSENKRNEALNYIRITGKHIWTSTIDPSKSKAGYYVVPDQAWQYGSKYGGFRARALPVRRFQKQ